MDQLFVLAVDPVFPGTGHTSGIPMPPPQLSPLLIPTLQHESLQRPGVYMDTVDELTRGGKGIGAGGNLALVAVMGCWLSTVGCQQ